jgi:hypothetical protein
MLARLHQVKWIVLFFVSMASVFMSRQIVLLRGGGVDVFDSILDSLAFSPSNVISLNSDPDRNCPFRNSAIYRSIYVYPSPGTDEWFRNDTGVVTGRRLLHGNYPWDDIDHLSRKESIGLYALDSPLMQVRKSAYPIRKSASFMESL